MKIMRIYVVLGLLSAAEATTQYVVIESFRNSDCSGSLTATTANVPGRCGVVQGRGWSYEKAMIKLNGQEISITYHGHTTWTKSPTCIGSSDDFTDKNVTLGSCVDSQLYTLQSIYTVKKEWYYGSATCGADGGDGSLTFYPLGFCRGHPGSLSASYKYVCRNGTVSTNYYLHNKECDDSYQSSGNCGDCDTFALDDGALDGGVCRDISTSGRWATNLSERMTADACTEDLPPTTTSTTSWTSTSTPFEDGVATGNTIHGVCGGHPTIILSLLALFVT